MQRGVGNRDETKEVVENRDAKSRGVRQMREWVVEMKQRR